MLIGEYEGKLTDKNRIAVPSKIRAELKKGLLVAKGYEGCLLMLDEERWRQLLKMIEIKPLLDLSARDTKRFLLGGAYDVELDVQGRFVVPAVLKEYAGLEEDITFVAIMDWVEIWDKQRWMAKSRELNEAASDIAERLTHGN